jgi:hypothetical protein
MVSTNNARFGGWRRCRTKARADAARSCHAAQRADAPSPPVIHQFCEFLIDRISPARTGCKCSYRMAGKPG